jgi:hypothetical protein
MAARAAGLDFPKLLIKGFAYLFSSRASAF